MPVTDSFIAFIVEQLEGAGAITTKRMFGGVGLYAGDSFFALIWQDLVYFKADAVFRSSRWHPRGCRGALPLGREIDRGRPR